MEKGIERENKLLDICGVRTFVGWVRTCYFICFVKSTHWKQNSILLWTEVTNEWDDIPYNKHPLGQENLEVVCGQ